MFGLFANKKIEVLEKVVMGLRNWGNLIEKHMHGTEEKLHNFDERLKKIESLLNEPLSSNQEIVEEITTTKAALQVLTKHGNELSINSIFDMIKRYNLKNPDVTKDSLRALLYGLRREGRIGYGEEPGTFKSVPGISC